MDFNMLHCSVEYGTVSNDMNSPGTSYDGKHMFSITETTTEASFQLAVSKVKQRVQETKGYAVVRMDDEIVYSLAYLDDWLTQDFINKSKQKQLSAQEIDRQRETAAKQITYQPVARAGCSHKYKGSTSYTKPRSHSTHSQRTSKPSHHHKHGKSSKSSINVKW